MQPISTNGPNRHRRPLSKSLPMTLKKKNGRLISPGAGLSSAGCVGDCLRDRLRIIPTLVFRVLLRVRGSEANTQLQENMVSVLEIVIPAQ